MREMHRLQVQKLLSHRHYMYKAITCSFYALKHKKSFIELETVSSDQFSNFPILKIRGDFGVGLYTQWLLNFGFEAVGF